MQLAVHNFITWPDHRLKSDDRLWDFVILILQVQPFRTYSGNCTWHWNGFLYNMCPAQGMYTVPPSKVRTIMYFLFSRSFHRSGFNCVPLIYNSFDVGTWSWSWCFHILKTASGFKLTKEQNTYLPPALPNTVIVQCDVLLQYGVTVMTHTVKYGYIAYHVDTGTAVELP